MKWIVVKSEYDFDYPTYHQYGWGNGYVLIPPRHPYYKVDYHELNLHIYVHGGLTFSRMIDKNMLKYYHELNESHIGLWMVGFDTKHWGDNLKLWPKEEVIKETINLRNQLIKLGYKINYRFLE